MPRYLPVLLAVVSVTGAAFAAPASAQLPPYVRCYDVYAESRATPRVSVCTPFTP